MLNDHVLHNTIYSSQLHSFLGNLMQARVPPSATGSVPPCPGIPSKSLRNDSPHHIYHCSMKHGPSTPHLPAWDPPGMNIISRGSVLLLMLPPRCYEDHLQAQEIAPSRLLVTLSHVDACTTLRTRAPSLSLPVHPYRACLAGLTYLLTLIIRN